MKDHTREPEDWILLSALLMAAIGLVLFVLLMSAQAQPVTRLCVQLAGPGGGLACNDISSTNPLPTSPAPSSAAGFGITAVVSAAAEASHVLKASAGNLYGIYVANPSASGFLMVFNSTAVPSDGAVTPIECVPVSASNVAFVNYLPGPPEVFSTGISVALSSTGCFTKTTSPTGFFHGYVQ